MGKHFALALQLPAFHSQERRKAKISPAIKLQQIGTVVLVGSVLAVLFYLVQVNTFSTKGYEITKLQSQISKLQDQYKTLELQSAQLQSIQNIQSDPKILNMVPTSSITYIQATSLTQR